MLIAHDRYLVRVGTVFVRQLDAYAVVVADLVYCGSLAADNVRVVLGVNRKGHREAA